jgi:hypothetical protein
MAELGKVEERRDYLRHCRSLRFPSQLIENVRWQCGSARVPALWGVPVDNARDHISADLETAMIFRPDLLDLAGRRGFVDITCRVGWLALTASR